LEQLNRKNIRVREQLNAECRMPNAPGNTSKIAIR